MLLDPARGCGRQGGSHPDFAPDYNNGRDKVKDPSYDYFETIE